MGEAIEIDADKFYTRLGRLVQSWTNDGAASWEGVDSICIMLGTHDEESSYSKASALHLFLLGYEITDSIIVIVKGHFWFLASEKKCKYLESSLANESSTITFHSLHKSKDEGMNLEHFNFLLGVIRKAGPKLGSLFQAELKGPFMEKWLNSIDKSQLVKTEISQSIGKFLSVKDDIELDFCRRAAVLSNKVLKHGFVQEMESIVDDDKKVKHDVLALKVEGIILEPSKIGLNVSADAVDACYTPIIQSGGKYDIKISAQSNEDILSSDVIICSLGAKYKGYCANVARTFMVNVCPKIEETYALLLSLYNHCLEKMLVGVEIKDVYLSAKQFLSKNDSNLLAYFPKSLGFATGLEFRDSQFVINDKNTQKLAEGMVFNLSVGFHNVPLTAEEKKDLVPALNVFSLLLSDTILIQKNAIPEVLTKMTKEFGDVSYSIAENRDEEDDDMDVEENAENEGLRRSKRSKEDRAISEQAAQQRANRQHELMKKKIEEARRKLAAGVSQAEENTDDPSKFAVDLKTYKSTSDYPKEVVGNQIRVDMEKECLFLPINGRAVPFHVSTIKAITRPEEDKAAWMRVNFFAPGSSVKDAPKNMQHLVVKYGGHNVFIKELTFKSLNSRNMTQVYQMFQELRKRIKQREQKAEQEKDLVVQMKLIRIKDQRVPRLQDLTMRPQITGRKCVGTIEAHQNGLRFTSSKGEILDIMYANIKHAIYQPCDKTTMVLIHFHLKDFIMIGKKKQKDVQFYTEVIDASLNLEGARRSSYDPDELDEEQREKEMRKRLNLAFKEFCVKVEKVAAHYGYSLQVDIPFRKSGFEGNCHKEMVFLQPTTHCLVNLTEVPPFVLTLSDVDHVHFERVTYATRNFDATFIFKNQMILPRTITAIDMKYMDTIQDWLNLVEITYTLGARSMNWVDIMGAVRESGEFFYLDKDEDGEKKVPGWLFLSGEASDDEDGEGEEDDDDESFASSEVSDEESDEDSEDDESDYADSDEDEDDDGEDDEDDEEEGKDWDELERDALASDKAKRKQEEETEEPRNKKNQKVRR